MTAKHLRYWEYDREATVECYACGWSGRGSQNEEHFEELLDVRCPTCEKMLLIEGLVAPSTVRRWPRSCAPARLGRAQVPRARESSSKVSDVVRRRCDDVLRDHRRAAVRTDRIPHADTVRASGPVARPLAARTPTQARPCPAGRTGSDPPRRRSAGGGPPLRPASRGPRAPGSCPR